MSGTKRGTTVPALRPLAALVFALIAFAPIAAHADDGLVDVRTLPQLEGAMPTERSARETHPETSLSYQVPMVVALATPATRKLLAASGWIEYVYPDPSGRTMSFKKAPQGLLLHFTQGLGRPDQSVVYYSADRLYNNIPFPDGATDIVFDDRRPYLGCVSPATVEASLDFFRQGLLVAGWTQLSTADIAARWPDAKPAESIANGAVAYFNNDTRDGGPKHQPIMLSLLRRDDGKTGVEITIAPFVLPQNLTLAKAEIGLPVPDHTAGFGSTGSSDSVRRKVEGKVEADLPVVLAFFRRELSAQNWKEESDGAAITDSNVTLYFSSPDQNAKLTLNHKYDLTFVTINTQVKDSALAARAKAKKEADDKFFADAQAAAKQLMAADEVRRAAQAANLSGAPLRAAAGQTMPVPLPEGADNVKFDGAEGKLEFDSGSSVQTLAAFYRGYLKPLGWKEQPSVINKPNMVVMEFSKGGKELSFTAMQMGPKVNVSADGSGLVMANAKVADAKPAATGNQATTGSATAVQALEAEPNSALPVPKEHTMSSIGVGKLPGTDTAVRRELNASVSADLGSVLAFYRGELTKLGWKESAERAVVKPDQAQLAFASPDGPATLKLGRNNGETSIDLAQKFPAAAAKGEIMPKPGQARLMFVIMGESEAALTINKQTIKITAGAGARAKGPTLDLPPGKYQYSLKVGGGPARSNSIEVAADDAWGLMVAPSGDVMPLQVY